MGTLATVLTGTNFRSTVTVCSVLVIGLVVTGFLSSAYRRAKESQGRHHYEIGRALDATGNVEGAAEQYREALLFLPDESEYRLALSVALVNSGRLTEAESHLEQLGEADPGNGLISLILAKIAERRNDPVKAIDYLQRAVYAYWPRDKLPVRHNARWQLVSLLERQGRRNEVVGELLQLYANSGNNIDEKIKIGNQLTQYGATSDAIRLFTELTRIDPRSSAGFRGLGEARIAAGEFTAARRNFQRALRVNPSDKGSAAQLAFVNSVMEMDPAQPRLRSTERLRKSEQLLAAVIKPLDECAQQDTAGQVSQALRDQLTAAQSLLSDQSGDTDQRSNQMQDASQQLWSQRGKFCAAHAPQNKTIDAVIAGISQ